MLEASREIVTVVPIARGRGRRQPAYLDGDPLGVGGGEGDRLRFGGGAYVERVRAAATWGEGVVPSVTWTVEVRSPPRRSLW